MTLDRLKISTVLRRALCHPIFVLIVAVVFCVWFAGWQSSAIAADDEGYWLQQGGMKVKTCVGAREELALKVANGGNAWVLITGQVGCIDAGDVFRYRIKHLSVQINPSSRARIVREKLNFDWIGLALYRPRSGASGIEWLFDNSLPIDGSLEKSSDGIIYFGNVEFDVPKSASNQAARLLFYMTSEGVLYQFWML
ncbi:hypothetical protein [Methylobacterium sp. D48H]